MGDIYTNSMLKDWKQCQRNYYYKYVKKIVIPKKEDNFELGKKVHALISYKLNGFDTKVMLQAVDDNVLKHYESILNHPLMKQTSLRSEWGFSVNIGKTSDMFMGRIDAIFFDEQTGKYTIADWKTGMNIPKVPIDDEQARIYLYAFYRCKDDLKLDIEPENIRFTFVQTPSLNESSLDFSTKLNDMFEADFLNTIKDIKNYRHDSIPQENSNCKFCEYRFLCFKN